MEQGRSAQLAHRGLQSCGVASCCHIVARCCRVAVPSRHRAVLPCRVAASLRGVVTLSVPPRRVVALSRCVVALCRRVAPPCCHVTVPLHRRAAVSCRRIVTLPCRRAIASSHWARGHHWHVWCQVVGVDRVIVSAPSTATLVPSALLGGVWMAVCRFFLLT